MTNPVDVLGAAAITAFGDAEATLDALEHAAEAAAAIVGPTRIDARRDRGAVVDARDVHAPLPPELDAQVKFLSGSGRLLADAMQSAASRAGLTPDAERAHRRGLWLAQMDAGDWDCHDFAAALRAAREAENTDDPSDESINRASLRLVRPYFLLEDLKNNAFSFLASWFDLRGANTSTAGNAATGVALLDLAARAVAAGRLDLSVVAFGARMTPPIARHERSLGIGGLDPETPAGDGAAVLVLGPEGGSAAATRITRIDIGRDVGDPAPAHATWVLGSNATEETPLLPGDVALAREGLALALLDAAARRGRLPVRGGGTRPWPVGASVLLRSLGAAGLDGCVRVERLR